MISQRRSAQLGLLSACFVFVSGLGALVHGSLAARRDFDARCLGRDRPAQGELTVAVVAAKSGACQGE
jgi:hypothetical protein